MESDKEVGQIFAALKQRDILLKLKIKLFIDAESLKPMYQAIISAGDFGDFVSQSNISKEETLKLTLLKLKEHIKMNAPDLLLEAPTMNAPSVPETKLKLTAGDFQRVKLIREFNSGILHHRINNRIIS